MGVQNNNHYKVAAKELTRKKKQNPESHKNNIAARPASTNPKQCPI
jgi:hypothetical protein